MYVYRATGDRKILKLAAIVVDVSCFSRDEFGSQEMGVKRWLDSESIGESFFFLNSEAGSNCSRCECDLIMIHGDFRNREEYYKVCWMRVLDATGYWMSDKRS